MASHSQNDDQEKSHLTICENSYGNEHFDKTMEEKLLK